MDRILSPLLIAVVFFISCSQHKDHIEEQNRLFKKEYKLVLREIENMIENDQAIRRVVNYGTCDTLYIDSLKNIFASKNIDLDSLLLIKDTFLVSAHFMDSVDKEMLSLNEKHTLKLIELINKYGYPESNRIDSALRISPFILMHHPAIRYKDTMMKLLSFELAAKRIDTISYEMIKWDYDGRVGLPDLPGMKVHKNDDGTTTIEL